MSLTWPFGRIRESCLCARERGRYARSESEPSEGPPLGRLAHCLDREYEQRRQHCPAAHLLCKDQGAPRGSEPSCAANRELRLAARQRRVEGSCRGGSRKWTGRPHQV